MLNNQSILTDAKHSTVRLQEPHFSSTVVVTMDIQSDYKASVDTNAPYHHFPNIDYCIMFPCNYQASDETDLLSSRSDTALASRNIKSLHIFI
jgi:hypothetical protein